MMDKRADGEFVIVSCGMLGYGFPEQSLENAVDIGLDLIAVDAGSSDPGPYCLGSGKTFCNEELVRRDLDLLVSAQRRSGATMVIGSAGGAGTDAHLQQTLEILQDCIRRGGKATRVAVISSELRKQEVHDALAGGQLSAFETGALPTPADIDQATSIVAQIGVEPIIRALGDHPDIVLCGRSWDPGNIAALPISLGMDAGLAIHAGKILECGAQAALPVAGSDLLLGRLRQGDFIIEPLAEGKRCTVPSVAAHTLYEKTNPVLLPGPGGMSDLRETEFEALDERRVRVSGSRWIKDNVHRVKIEGARLAGWRNIVIGGLRDPGMIGQIDRIQKDVVVRIDALLGQRIGSGQYAIRFHRYGLDGVMGPLEPLKVVPHEIGLLIDVVAETESIAAAVASAARSLLLHWSFPGRVATAGNMALPFSPAEMPGGPVYEFNLYHLLDMPDPASRFGYSMELVH